ncbi:hypothetical protein E1B28_002003 [Marasmius oreades]|nr:uncharacterized protein E1B28_002003 [Marasmius oreades]KAG7100229.1 hypothetical protein E1B28_002003 [Marasmius oreades]
MNTAECRNDITKRFSALRVKVTLKENAPYAIGKLFETWCAESSRKDIYVKILRSQRNGVDETFFSRALRWSDIKHENVLNLWGIALVKSSLGLVSPRLKNGNILSYLENNPLHDRLKSITEISAGLSYLHSLNPPLVHGNIKSGNVIVSDDLRCCLADLSITTEVARNAKTSMVIYGSVRWLAPEVIHATKPPDVNNTPRDIFSYALTIVEIMTGQNPFSELTYEPAVAVAIARGKRPPRPTHPKEGWCPDYVWDLVERCWQQDPIKRPKAREVHQYLKGLLEVGGEGDIPVLGSDSDVSEAGLNLWNHALPTERAAEPGRRRLMGKDEGISRKYLPHEVYSRLFDLAKRETEASHFDEHLPGSSESISLLVYPEEDIQAGIVQGIIQGHRYRERLYEVLHRAPTMNAAEVYQAVLKDEEGVAELVETVLTSKHDMADVLMLREGDMECFMNALQDILDNSESKLINRLREKIRCLLATLCKKATGLPQAMFIDGVAPPQRNICGGAFGDVFRSVYEGKYVALKRLRFFRGSEQGKVCKKFCKEARLWKRLNHKYVLPLLGIDADTFPRQPCMVSPWMFNGTINEFLKRKEKGSVDLLRLIHEVIQGIEFLHSQGVVHGDIKGANILIDDKFHPRLTDFGLTVFQDVEHNTTDFGGTLRWMAPELFFGEKANHRTFASDIYAFGCVCVELYTGKPPFAEEASHDLHVLTKVCGGERPRRPSDMPDKLWALVVKCWNHRSELRPSSEEVSREVEQVTSC